MIAKRTAIKPNRRFSLMSHFTLPPLYAIANVDALENPVSCISRLVRGGVELIQIRAKLLDDNNFCEIVSAALKLSDAVSRRKQQPLIVVNDRPQVCLATGASALHVGMKDYLQLNPRQILGEKVIIGLSTHNLEQVIFANTQQVDYLGFGPVYASNTKSGHAPITGLKLLKTVVKVSDKPISAIGGITLERAREVYDTRVSGVAVVGDLENNLDLKQHVAAYYKQYRFSQNRNLKPQENPQENSVPFLS